MVSSTSQCFEKYTLATLSEISKTENSDWKSRTSERWFFGWSFWNSQSLLHRSSYQVFASATTLVGVRYLSGMQRFLYAINLKEYHRDSNEWNVLFPWDFRDARFFVISPQDQFKTLFQLPFPFFILKSVDRFWDHILHYGFVDRHCFFSNNRCTFYRYLMLSGYSGRNGPPPREDWLMSSNKSIKPNTRTDWDAMLFLDFSYFVCKCSTLSSRFLSP